MKKNIGRLDSIIRIIIAVILFYFMDGQSREIQIAFAVISAALLFTAFNGFCVLYRLFGFSTRTKEDKA